MKRLMLVCVMILCLATVAFADEAVFAPQGMYRVFCVDDLYGVQSLDGKTVIPAQFAGIQPFKDDLCLVEAEYEGESCFGLWRLSTGEELLPCMYACMQIAGQMVLASDPCGPETEYAMTQLFDPESGTVVLNVHDTDYDRIDYYVPLPLAGGEYFTLSRDSESDECLISPDGTVLIDSPVSMVGHSSASWGIVDIMLADEHRLPFRFYNIATRSWLDGSYGWTFGFIDGYAAVEGVDREWYVIDEAGHVVTPPYRSIAFDDIFGVEYGQYGQGLFAVKQKDGWYIIRVSSGTEPEILLGPVICDRDPLYIEDQVFALRTDNGTLLFSAADGRQLLLEGITVEDPHAVHCIVTCRGDRKGFAFDDLTVIDPAFDDCLPFLEDFGFVKAGDLWHPINREGQVDLSISYPQVQYSSEGGYYLAEVSSDSYLCLNPNLEPISFVISEPDVFILM